MHHDDGSGKDISVFGRQRLQLDWHFGLAILATGVTAGLAAMSLAMLLHLIQHLAYGYSLDRIVGHISFLEGVRAAAPERRLAALLLCGGIAGLGWWAVRRFGRPLLSISAVIGNPDQRMPAGTTLAHVLLQIVTIGLGSPLGREVAPREIGTLLAGGLARHFGLPVDRTRILLACGAGAGLAAVYNVPLAGALFALEVLLVSFAPAAAIAALASSAIAAYVAWIGLGDETQYVLPPLTFNVTLVGWALLCGPCFGAGAWLFARLTDWARRHAPRNAMRIPACLLAFGGIGGIAVFFPEILGNGKGPIQLGFAGDVGLHLAGTLLVLKLLCTLLALLAGASGGLLTPGMSIGALMGLLLGGLANISGWITVMPGSAVLIGAAAFLSVSMRMPLTALVLAFELTHADRDFAIPMMLAIAGATAAAHLLDGRVAPALKDRK